MTRPSSISPARRLGAAALALLVLLCGVWPAPPRLTAAAVLTGAGNETRVVTRTGCSCGCESGAGACCCAGEPAPSAGTAADPCFRSPPCGDAGWTPLARDILQAVPPAGLRLVSSPGSSGGAFSARNHPPRRVPRAPDTPPPILHPV